MNSEKLNILFLAAWYPSKENEFAGLFIEEHAKAIENNVNLFITTIRFEKKNKFPSIIIKKERRNRMVFFDVLITSPLRRFGFYDFLIKRAYSKVVSIIEKDSVINVIHVNVRDHITKLIIDVKKINHLPIILSEHFSFYHRGIKLLSVEKQKQQYSEIKKWFSNDRVKYVMPVSEQLSTVLIDDFDVDKNKIKVIPNIAGKEFYSKLKKQDNNIRILLVANWQAPKNPFLFLDSLLLLKHELKNVQIDWIGEGEQINEVKNIVNEKLSDLNIVFHGFQNKDFIATKMRAASFFVHPTDAENLPTVIIESLTCGTPVLSHRVNGIPELINDTNGVLCELKNIDDLVNKIKFMLSNYKFFNSEKISNYAKMKFSSNVVGKQILDIYKVVL